MHTVLCSLGLQLSHGITVKVSGDLVVILKIHEENLLNMTCYFLPQVSVIVVMVIVSPGRHRCCVQSTITGLWFLRTSSFGIELVHVDSIIHWFL